VATDKGVPQGGIVSPLLSNLVLHELDEYIGKIIEEKSKAMAGVNPYGPNRAYSKKTHVISSLNARIRTMKRLSAEERLKKRLAVQERLKLPSLTPNPAYSRFEYIRYADD
jgi:retron-type reverse transcriptase